MPDSRYWKRVRVLIGVFGLLIGAGVNADSPSGLGVTQWDPARYIDINEVKPGQEAYCLTVYQGATVERFPLDVVDVMYGFSPGQDVILVQGTDDRFIHTGPVAGCSGSPVFIDGRLAGALAFGWPLSKDPLYGVTAIRDMLAIGQGRPHARAGTSLKHTPMGHTDFSCDYSAPLDFNLLADYLFPESQGRQTGTQAILECPLLCSGLKPSVHGFLTDIFAPRGFLPVAGAGRSGLSTLSTSTFNRGSVMMVPLVDGDVRLTVLGTVTEVVDQRVFGFGHSFLGQGTIDLPLATGHVHTIVSNLSKSFKLGSVLETVGSLTHDEPTGVVGILGKQARMIPVTLRIKHYLHPSEVEYECQMARHLELTPQLLKALIGGTILGFGAFPLDHMVRYSGTLTLDNGRILRFENVSAGMGTREMLTEVLGSVVLLMNNPFRDVGIQNLELDIEVTPVNGRSFIASLDVPDRQVRAGEAFSVQVTVEAYRSAKRRCEMRVPVPKDMPPGTYELTVCGAYDYQRIVRRRAPYKLVARDMDTLIDALDFVLNMDRDRLYFVLELPSRGLALERQEMPRLPATKALVLRSTKKTVQLMPFQPWWEQSLQTGLVTANGQRVRIKVE